MSNKTVKFEIQELGKEAFIEKYFPPLIGCSNVPDADLITMAIMSRIESHIENITKELMLNLHDSSDEFVLPDKNPRVMGEISQTINGKHYRIQIQLNFIPDEN